MANWLFKSEPDTYSYEDLVRDRTTVWDGVSNPLAKKHLRALKPGDRVWLYHTGKEKAIVAEIRVSAMPVEADGEVTVKVEPGRKLPRPVTLAAIRGNETLADWELVRLPRLSVMPATDLQWSEVERMGA